MWGDREELIEKAEPRRRGKVLLFMGLLVVVGGGLFWLANQNDQPDVVELSLDSSQPQILHQLRDDPSTDGWTSELFARNADKQLKVIGNWLVDPGLISETKANRLAADEFACGSLRPPTVDRVFDQSPIYIERVESIESSDPVYFGPEGLVEALHDLLKPFAEFRTQHAHFKTYKIESSDDYLVTEQYVSITGVTDEGRVEENSIWSARWTNEKSPRLLSLDVTDFERATATRTLPILADCTEAVLAHRLVEDDLLGYGINHWCARIPGYYGMNCIGHHGLAVGDVNGDGLDDIYVCHAAGMPNQLLIQQADGTVLDRAKETGVDWLDLTTSALIVDLDNDGFQDLILGIRSQLMFMKNYRNESFKQRFLADAGPVELMSLASADYDNDGDLDIYACSYKSPGIGPLPFHDANNGPPNVLWRNEANWNFTNVTSEVGLGMNNMRFSFAASWEDFDNDGDLDLYVANDYGRNNLYQNSKGHFVDIAGAAGVEDVASGMSVSFGDYDHDGRMDLYVANMFSSAGNRIAYQQRFNPSVSKDARAMFQRHARGNSLFRSKPDGTFEDVSEATGVTMGRWAWCSRFIDFNNDSFDDIFVVNGYMTNSNPDDL